MTRLAYILASIALFALASGCCCSHLGGGGYSGYSGYPSSGGGCPNGQCGSSYGPTFQPQSYPSASLPAYSTTAAAPAQPGTSTW